MRAGDVVLHRPTGEEWVVAYADPVRDALAWAGWPEGIAKMSDCELVQVATDEEHERALRSWLDPRSGPRQGDHRPGAMRRLYPEAVARVEAELAAERAAEPKLPTYDDEPEAAS